ncbi:MAG: glutamate--cysteine ligase [Rhodoferax sp.]
MDKFSTALGGLTPQRLQGIRRGIEKESLRTDPEAALAATPHPAALGSALTLPRITTDFSEAQLELITGVHASVDDCLRELTQIQQFTVRAMGDELLWVSSMPCGLPDDAAIPVGQYGSSNTGRLKSMYRVGLGHRYGRRMQTISGIHYNWSVSETSSADYFGLIRNFRRNAFLLLYLFGASPAVCGSFVAGREHRLQPLAEGTLYLPHATSLRMGRLGYQSDAQAALAVSYNDLAGYANALEQALTQPYAPYAAVGVKAPDGQYRQLSTSLLQIENEFYGTIRPKRVLQGDERPLHALRARGVEYVEVRLLDLNPFEVVGISAQTMRFLDVFLLHCLASPSAPDSPEEVAAVARNQHRVAERGREPGLTLERGAQRVSLVDWGLELVPQWRAIAQALDAAQGGTAHAAAVDAAEHGLRQSDDLPSAQVLREMVDLHAGSFVKFVKACSARTRQTMLAQPLAPAVAAHFQQLAQRSLAEQTQIEQSDTLTLDDYLTQYLSAQRLQP